MDDALCACRLEPDLVAEGPDLAEASVSGRVGIASEVAVGSLRRVKLAVGGHVPWCYVDSKFKCDEGLLLTPVGQRSARISVRGTLPKTGFSSAQR